MKAKTLPLSIQKRMLADRIALKRSQNNEEQLYKQLTKFFNRLKKEVLKALEEYWSDYQLFQGQVNLICSPVHEAHREYYEILEKYKKREYRLGVKEAERQVKNENRKHKIALKAVQTFPISSFIKKDKDALFGTLPSAERDMLNKTFTASERTLSRVDSQINQIITDGYRQGYGINQIANDLTRRFDQLSTWESKRIARTEIHGSHNTAVMDTYRDMDVEYIQWDAAGDDRTRDSHVEIDGEIIPIGSTFSNGLQFPGDTSGPIEEWINCRCSNAPFVIPYGFIAPSFSPFKESDLIPVTQETLQEPTQEQLNSNLTDEQRMEYNKLKADMKLAEDIINSPFYTEREKSQAITSYQQNAFKLNQLKQIAHGKLAEGYANLVKNVVGTTETKEPEFKQVGDEIPTDPEQLQQEIHDLLIKKQNDELGLLSEFRLEELLEHQGFNKYALNDAELKRYKELKPLGEKGELKFREKREYRKLSERKEFSDMWNEILLKEGDPHDVMSHSVRYEKLYEQFKDWERLESFSATPIEVNTNNIFKDNGAFKLTAEEKKQYKQLKTNREHLTPEQKEYYAQLQDKTTLNKLHNELLNEGLNAYDSKRYIELYSKHKEWGLPELSYELKFSVPKQGWETDHIEGEIGNKYALSKEQINELDRLQKKKLFADNGMGEITSRELTRIDELQNQRHFNQLYYSRKNEGGLTYDSQLDFERLFKQFEKKFNLSKSLLKQELPKYENNIKPNSTEKPLKLKGTTEDGLPPKHEIKELFTLDIRNASANERRVVTRWMGSEFHYFRDYIVRSEGDVNRYIDYVLHASEEQLKHYGYIKKLVEEGNITQVKTEINRIAKSLDHDLPVLNNILENNCTKKAMTFWRKEGKHHLGENPKPGDVITFKGKNSTAITLDGAEHFGEVSHREFPWTYEIEAPAGTKGAYISHLSLNERIRREMEFLLADDTQMKIIKFDEANSYAKLRIIVD